MAPPRRVPPKGTALAKLEGRIFFEVPAVHNFTYYMERRSLRIGRSDVSQLPRGNPLLPADAGQCDLGVGDSSKLSRVHAEIFLPAEGDKFAIRCIGKNGLNVSLPPYNSVNCMKIGSEPILLETRSLIQMGECIFCFFLPSNGFIGNGANNNNSNANRKWTKTEQTTLRSLLLRFGYSRWNDILKNATGRLVERSLASIQEEAKTFLVFCYVYADNTEKKCMHLLLSQCLDEYDDHGDSLEEYVCAIVEKFDHFKNDDEKLKDSKKYKRWARKLRMLQRIGYAYNHSALQQLRIGELELKNSPPEPCWTCQDDYDLVIGTFKHGLGHNESIRSDKQLGFHNRFRPQPASRRGKVVGKSRENNMKSSDDDIDEDDANVELDSNDDVRPLKEDNEFDAIMKNVSGVDLNSIAAKSKPTARASIDIVRDGSANGANGDAKMEEVGSRVNGNMKSVPGNAGSSSELDGGDARVMFPGAEPLMKRLKQIVTACNKVHDRDMKELRKKEEYTLRAAQRRQNQEEKRRLKSEEKKKIQEEKRLTRTQPFSKKDAAEFEKALANHGARTDGAGHIMWDDFIRNAPALAHKFPNTLGNMLDDFLREHNRLNEYDAAKEDGDTERMEELNMGDVKSDIFSNLTVERANKVVGRLSIFRTLRDEMLSHPQLTDRLRSCKRTKELPMWWRSVHDIALLEATSIYGMAQWDKVQDDPQYPFKKTMEEHQEKYKDQKVPLRKGLFPKAIIANKRISTLVNLFREKAANAVYRENSSIKDGPVRTGAWDGDGYADEDVHMQQNQNQPVVEEPNVPAEPVRKVPTEIINLLDEKGDLILPAIISHDLLLLELGTVMEGPDWHTENDIYLSGYRSVRTINGEAFLCEIRKRSDNPHIYAQPVFRVSRLVGFQTGDHTKHMWEGSAIVAEANAPANLVIGGNFGRGQLGCTMGVLEFGLRNLTIRHYIEQLPHVKDFCKRYRKSMEKGSLGIKDVMVRGLRQERNLGLHKIEETNAGSAGENGRLEQYHHQQHLQPQRQHHQQQQQNQYQYQEIHLAGLTKRKSEEMSIPRDVQESHSRNKRQKGEPAWRQNEHANYSR